MKILDDLYWYLIDTVLSRDYIISDDSTTSKMYDISIDMILRGEY